MSGRVCVTHLHQHLLYTSEVKRLLFWWGVYVSCVKGCWSLQSGLGEWVNG